MRLLIREADWCTDQRPSPVLAPRDCPCGWQEERRRAMEETSFIQKKKLMEIKKKKHISLTAREFNQIVSLKLFFCAGTPPSTGIVVKCPGFCGTVPGL